MSAVQATTHLDPENPWPGMDSFLEADQEFFNGRTAAINELLRLVLRSRCVILYGASGLGKTSLLNAGLFPPLRTENVFPVYVRLGFSPDDITPTEQVKNAVLTQATEWGIQAPEMTGETLWECFHRKGTFFSNNRFRLVTPLLVFDQFEEIFTHGRSPQNVAIAKAFVQELSDLVEARVPAPVKERLDRNPDESLEFDFEVVVCRILLSLREDFLADLSEFRKQMPSVGQVAFRLQPMNEEQARQVIVKGGGRLVDDNVATRILGVMSPEILTRPDTLLNSGFLTSEISFEPVLLSLFCYELNKKRLAESLTKITAELVAGNRDQIIADFYTRNISDRSPEVRKFVENELVTQSGFRGTVDEEKALEVMTKEDVTKLVNRRLLRREPLGLSGRYRLELVHDVLAKTIRESRDARVREEQQQARLNAEEEARQARRAADAAAAREAQERKNAELATRLAERIKKGAYVLVLFLALAAVLAVLLQQQKSNTDRLLSENSRRTALENLASDHGESQALAYLAQALRTDEDNVAARSMTIELLLRSAWPIPVFAPDEPTSAEWVVWHPAGSSFLLPEGVDLRWVALDGRELGKLSHKMSVQSASFDANGKQVLTRTSDGSAHLWNLDGLRDSPVPEPYEVTASALSPDGTLIATGTVDGALSVWRSSDRSRYMEGLFHGDTIDSVSFSPDGRYVLTGSRDNRAQIFDLQKKMPLGKPLECGAAVTAAKFSGDGSRVFTLSGGVLAVWELANTARPYRKAEGLVTSAQWHGSGNDRILFSLGERVEVWDVDADARRYGTEASQAESSPSGQKILTIRKEGLHGLVQVWDETPALQPDSQLMAAIRLDSFIKAAEFDPAANYIITISAKRLVKVWDIRWPAIGNSSLITGESDGAVVFGDGDIDLRNRQLLRVSDGVVELVNLRDRQVVRKFVHSQVTQARFSPDAAIVATMSYEGSGDVVRLWNAATGQQLGEISGTFREFSHDGKRLATTKDDKIRISTVSGNGPPIEFDSDEEPSPVAKPDPNCPYLRPFLRFSPDGTRILAGGGDRSLRVWHTTTGPKIKPLDDEQGFQSAEFSPDGRQILAATCKGYQVWNADSHMKRYEFTDSEPGFFARFTPDGERALTTSADGNTRMWDIRSEKHIADLLRGVTARSINFSDDGSRIAILDSDGEIHVFSSVLGERLSLFPMYHSGADVAAFTPGGGALLSVATKRGEVLQWNVSIGQSRDADALADLAEVIGGHVLDDQGAATSDDRFYTRLRALRDRLAGRASEGPASSASRLMKFFRHKSTLVEELGRSLLPDR